MLTNHSCSDSCSHHHHEDHSSSEIGKKLEVLLFNAETRTEIETIIQDYLIPNLISFNVEPSISFIKSLLKNPSLPLIVYDLCFEVFSPSISFTLSIRQSKHDESQLNIMIEFVEAIYNHSSPKEIHSLLTEALTTHIVHTSRVSNSQQLEILNYGIHDHDNQAIFEHNLFLLNLFFQNLKRLPETEKRWQFFKFLESTLASVCSTRVETIQNEAYGDEDMMNSETHRKFKADRVFLEYSTCLADSLLDVSKTIFEKRSSECISQKVHLKRESDCFLQLCFSILSKIYSNDNLIQICLENGTILKIMQSVTSCKRTLNDILEYSSRFKAWSESNKSHEDEYESGSEESEEEEEDEEIKNFIFWDIKGVGIFIYLLLEKRMERSNFGLFILSDLYLFVMCKYYSEILVQSGLAGFANASLSILKYLFEHNVKKKGSLSIQFGVPEYDLASFFDLAQALISFMSICPDNKLRTEAYKVFQDYITRFNDEDRFNLLYHIMNKCPFPYLVAVILDRMKEEIILEYNAVFQRIGTKKMETLRELNEYNPVQPPSLEEVNEFLKNNKNTNETQNYFSKYSPNNAPKINYNSEAIKDIRLYAKDSKAFLVPHKIPNLLIELLEKYVDNPFESDNIQVVLRALNLYYFLLLRDSEPNVTGVLDSEMVSKMEEKVLNKLKESCHKLENVVAKSKSITQEDDSDELDYDELLDEFESEFSAEEIEALKELKQQEKENNIIREQSSHELDLHLLSEVLHRIEDILYK